MKKQEVLNAIWFLAWDAEGKLPKENKKLVIAAVNQLQESDLTQKR